MDCEAADISLILCHTDIDSFICKTQIMNLVVELPFTCIYLLIVVVLEDKVIWGILNLQHITLWNENLRKCALTFH